jgi:nitrogen regulatory protein P-II 1
MTARVIHVNAPAEARLYQVVAYVRPEAEARVLDALRPVPGLTGVTVVEGRGFGRGHRPNAADAEVVYGTAPVVRIEIMVSETLVDAVVHVVQAAAHTGRRGDGKVYVAPLLEATRIATGEGGAGAV